jgi:hypothetical protein
MLSLLIALERVIDRARHSLTAALATAELSQCAFCE